nr:hypothetical protein [Mammaliicoccus sp. Marseille-Q6498]
MITEKERQEFKNRIIAINNRLKDEAKEEGIEIKSSISDRWKYDEELERISRRPKDMRRIKKTNFVNGTKIVNREKIKYK